MKLERFYDILNEYQIQNYNYPLRNTSYSMFLMDKDFKELLNEFSETICDPSIIKSLKEEQESFNLCGIFIYNNGDQDKRLLIISKPGERSMSVSRSDEGFMVRTNPHYLIPVNTIYCMADLWKFEEITSQIRNNHIKGFNNYYENLGSRGLATKNSDGSWDVPGVIDMYKVRVNGIF